MENEMEYSDDIDAKALGKGVGDSIDPKKFDDVYKGLSDKELFCKKDPEACKDLPNLKFSDEEDDAIIAKKSGKTLKK